MVVVLMPHILSIYILKSLYIRDGSFGEDKHVAEQTYSVFFVLHYNIRSVRIGISDKIVVSFYYSEWFIFIVFVLDFDVILLTDCLVEICSCFFMPLYIIMRKTDIFIILN